MSSDKETPRQAMIGMMYLVLLALLAMNVSKSVLNSFIVINGAMEETNTAFDEKNGETLNAFENQYNQNKEKVGEFYFAAKRVVESSEELSDYMEHLKRHIIEHTAGKGPEETWPDSLYDLTNVEAVDNIDSPSHVLLGSDEINPISGEYTMLELKDKIKDWKRIMMAEVPERHKATYDLGFSYSKVKQTDGTYLSWELAHFYHAPLAAVITDITIFQTQVKNRESEVLKMLMSNISAKDFKFDKIEVKVIPNSNYVILGDSFKADVIVAAYSTTEHPILEVGTALDTAGKKMNEWSVANAVDTSRISVNEGVANYGYKPTSEGEVTWGGIIKLKKPGTNEFVMYPFEHTFIAAKASAVVSPVKMNVFYRGAKNDVEVSAAGFSASKIDIQVTNASKSGSNGQYIIKPGQGRECTVTVFVTKDDGTKMRVGEPRKFRVEPIPPATPKFATVAGSGKVTKAQVLASGRVTAKLENFLLNDESLKVKVTAFTMKIPVKGKYIPYKGKSSSITPQMKTALKNLRKGAVIIIDGIKTSTGGQPSRNIKGIISIEIK